MENWRSIKNFPNYEVSDMGRVRHVKTKRIRKPSVSVKGGYLYHNLYDFSGTRKGKYEHRLVAEAFLPNPLNKKMVIHSNGNKKDNKVSNLKWASDSESAIHSSRMKFFSNQKLDEEKVKKIWNCLRRGDSLKEIAKKFNVSIGAIGDIKYGKSWKYVTRILPPIIV